MEAKLLAVFSSGVPLKVSALCRDLEISRQTLYKYRRRFEVEGPAGLVERSRRPHSSPGRVSDATEEAIVRLRKELPLECGAQTIAYHLARRGETPPSVATIHRVLVRRGMVTPQPKKRPKVAWKRFVWPRPNDAWQIDATAWALADGQTVWIMDVLDDHSRALVAARVDTGPTAKAAWDAFTMAVDTWGLPARVMNDNGSCFTGRLSRNGEADFERMLRSLGVVQICSSPAHPQTCGKLERSLQTTKAWLRIQPAARSVGELQEQLDRWRRPLQPSPAPPSATGRNAGRTVGGQQPSRTGTGHRRTDQGQHPHGQQRRLHRVERLRRRHRQPPGRPARPCHCTRLHSRHLWPAGTPPSTHHRHHSPIPRNRPTSGSAPRLVSAMS